MVGKSTLASVLIGTEIPQRWTSTNGLVIYFGRNGIDIEKKKMVPLNEGMSYIKFIFLYTFQFLGIK